MGDDSAKNAGTLGIMAVLSVAALAAIGGSTNVCTFWRECARREMPMDFVTDSWNYSDLEQILAVFPDFPFKEKVELTLKQLGAYYEEVSYGQQNTHTGQPCKDCGIKQ